MGRSPSAPQTYNKNLSACRTTTEHLLNDGRGPQTSKKSSQSHQNEVGQKIKIKKKKKKGQQISGRRPEPSEGGREAGKVSTYLETCSQMGSGELGNLRGEHSDR